MLNEICKSKIYFSIDKVKCFNKSFLFVKEITKINWVQSFECIAVKITIVTMTPLRGKDQSKSSLHIGCIEQELFA